MVVDGSADGADILFQAVDRITAVQGFATMPTGFHYAAEEFLAESVGDDDAAFFADPGVPCGSDDHQEDNSAHNGNPPPNMLALTGCSNIHDNLAHPYKRKRDTYTQHTYQTVSQDTKPHPFQLLPGPAYIGLIITLLHDVLLCIVLFVGGWLRVHFVQALCRRGPLERVRPRYACR